MYFLEIREKEIFETIKRIKDFDFVIIGGYAINAYTLPRFSVDCDFVIMNRAEANKIKNVLVELGYHKEERKKVKTPYHGDFARYEKRLQDKFNVSVDLLISKVIDRQTSAFLTAEWIFNNSSLKILRGKTIQEEVKVRIPSPEALIIMKLLSCRVNDIRDIFMIINQVKDFEIIKKEISEKTDFNKQFNQLKDKILSKSFKDNLQGVFGSIPEKTFDRNKELVLKLGE